MKSHQYQIRKDRELQKSDSDLFGEWYKDINLNLHDAVVKPINYITARTIIEDYEWIGTMPLPKSCRYIYGIYFDGCLGGVEVFVEPSTRQFNEHHPRKVVQLNRGACCYWTPKNTASYLISKCIKMLKQEGVIAIIAYCTQEAGEFGTIYQSLGFDYVGDTEPATVYWLDGYWVASRTLGDKRKWAKERGEEWVAKFDNLKRKKLQGKYRYIRTFGTHKQNKEFRKLYEFEKQDYPKRKPSRKNSPKPIGKEGCRSLGLLQSKPEQ